MKKLIIRGIIEIVLTILFILAIYFLTPLHTILYNEASLRVEIASYGIWGPIGIIIFKIIEVIIWFIPGAIPTAVSGYFFGAYYGTVFALVGEIIGSTLLFLIARSLGKRVIFKYVDGEHHRRFDRFFKKRGIYALALFKIAPVLPKDIVTMVAGLSKMDLKKFIILNALFSFPPIFITAVLADELVQFDPTKIFLAVLVIIASAVYLLKNEIKRRLAQQQHL